LASFSGRSSARGVQKHHKFVFAKSPCRKLCKTIDKNFEVSSSSFFVCFVVFSGVSQREELKAAVKKQNIFFGAQSPKMLV
jgi:hypothetical protein